MDEIEQPDDEQTPVIFGRIPAPDRVFHGQPYWLVGQVNHRTQDKRDIVLNVWGTFCAECGERFVCKTPEHSPTFSPTRRCDAHRDAGRKVGARGSRKRQAAVHDNDEDLD